jgi:cholesterol transport system auxiliary component
MKPLILSTALLLAGCSGGLLAPSGSPAKLYTLSAPQDSTATVPKAAWQLVIDMPDARAELNTARIAVAPTVARIDYYADVAWADRPPAMLQELLLQTFDKSGKIAAVDRASRNIRADFTLATDLVQFQVDAGDTPPAVHVEIAARLIRSRDRSIVASRHFTATVPTGSAFEGAVGGFDEAFHDVLPAIVTWTLEQGNQNP